MKVLNFILCDEVRTEDNGKAILIGVYPHNIIVKQFPTRMTITAWLQFMTGRTNEAQIEIRVIDENRAVKMSGGGEVKVEDAALPATVTLAGILLEFTNPGKLIFQIKERGKKWQTVNTFAVEQSHS